MRKISFCEIWSFQSLFSQAPIRTFSLELFHTTYYIYKNYALKSVKKECNMLEIILVQGFCLLKIKITQFAECKESQIYSLPFRQAEASIY